ncbi:hypothetical protein TNCT_4971 [Trichonephila clavata]|uniref:Uncharacterized protein n=1 Tax=Trichonephila clavata TaxID=2740835 RepID=A0A8X6M047_TRICU|nr:hypothetical protein TNCT_4971 [Trichonephila clavata]
MTGELFSSCRSLPNAGVYPSPRTDCFFPHFRLARADLGCSNGVLLLAKKVLSVTRKDGSRFSPYLRMKENNYYHIVLFTLSGRN